MAAKNDFVFSITLNAEEIQSCIQESVTRTWDPILTQVKTYKGDCEGTNLIKQVPAGFNVETVPSFACFASN